MRPIRPGRPVVHKLMKYTIPGRLSGANEAFKESNRHFAIGNRLKHAETRRCAEAAIAGGVPKIQKPILMHFHWFEPNQRRDIDNVRYGAKYIMDGLRECGRLPNDGWAWVKGMSDTFSLDRDNPRVEVTITDVF